MHTHHHDQRSGRVLLWSLAATSAFVVVELVAGLRAHSLALVSDAGHNATDALALLLASFAAWFQTKPADASRTFGYHRAGVLAAFINALTLIVLSLWIVYESWGRLMQPVAVNVTVMLWVAAAAVVLNGGIMLGLQSGTHDINVRGAFLHMMGDLFGSGAIVAGALLIRATGWNRIDPVLSIAISVLIIWTAWDITRESLNILLEGSPRGIETSKVIESVGSVDGVMGVHDLHIWSLGSNAHALSCHVLIEDMPPSRSDRILQDINALLGEQFRINHTTVQFEHASCAISDTGCVIPVESAHAHRHSHHGHTH